MAQPGHTLANTRTRRQTTLSHASWAAICLLLPSLCGFVAYQLVSRQPEAIVPSIGQLSGLTRQVAPELPIPDLARPQPDAPLANTVEFVVRRNDTLERIFRQLQLNLADLASIRALPEVKRTLDMLKPGDPITFSHNDAGDLQSLSRQVDNTTRLSVTREGAGFKAELITTPLTVRTANIRGTVTESLFASAQNAGLSAELIMRLANDIFGWDIDFALDIRQGDRFNVIYEKQYRDEEYIGDGRILAAEFVNDGRAYRAIRYDSANGEVGNYFTPEGRSLHRAFLRTPVDFNRISSGFSLARLHPVLNRIRAHRGVDYAAATGTPIKSAGDGRIIFQGRQGGYGNVIIVDHGSGITTLYGHMSRFGKTGGKGARVKQGGIIGYVGMTGTATGPHLHYEYRINGAHKDPRTVKLPNAAPLPDQYLADFQTRSASLLARLDRGSQQWVSASPPRR